MQTVWQVRVLADVGADATCGRGLAAWDALVAPSPARLTTATIEFEDPDEPCLSRPAAAIAASRTSSTASRSIASARPATPASSGRATTPRSTATIEAIDGGDRVRSRRIGRDSILRFRTGDWVEVTDDRREFARRSGRMLRGAEVNEDTSQLSSRASTRRPAAPI